jgi:hypothetical protein
MEYTIKSRKLKREIIFCRPSDYYIYVNLNNKSGYLGQQICKKGALSGSCLGVSGDDYDEETQKKFERVCKAWWKNYCAQYDADYLY